MISRRRLQICQEVIKGLALCHLNEQPNHRIPVPPRRLTAKTTLLQLSGTESIPNERIPINCKKKYMYVRGVTIHE